MMKAEIINSLTRAIRAADAHFGKVGGSSRHWVAECFLPALEDEGLEVVLKKDTDEQKND